jgi:hypothetical protein
MVCAVFVTICLCVIILPTGRQAVLGVARLITGSDLPQPELGPSPGPFPGEQQPPQGPYIEVIVLSLERLKTGELEGRFRLTPRNGLGDVSAEEMLGGLFRTSLKLWDEQAAPIRFRWESGVIVDPPGPTLVTRPIHARGTEETGRSFGPVDLVTGASLKSVASGQLHYIIDSWGPWTCYAGNGQKMEVPIWGQGKVSFLRR